jgi:hypothetical protein
MPLISRAALRIEGRRPTPPPEIPGAAATACAGFVPPKRQKPNSKFDALEGL